MLCLNMERVWSVASVTELCVVSIRLRRCCQDMMFTTLTNSLFVREKKKFTFIARFSVTEPKHHRTLKETPERQRQPGLDLFCEAVPSTRTSSVFHP